MEKIYINIRNIIRAYLREHAINKTSCLTNTLPNRYIANYLTSDLNYICYFVQKGMHKSDYFFFHQFYSANRKLKFDVINSSLDFCFKKRKFGYVNFHCKDLKEANHYLNYFMKNKLSINIDGSFILKISSEQNISSVDTPEFCSIISTQDSKNIIYRVR